MTDCEETTPRCRADHRASRFPDHRPNPYFSFWLCDSVQRGTPCSGVAAKSSAVNHHLNKFGCDGHSTLIWWRASHTPRSGFVRRQTFMQGDEDWRKLLSQQSYRFSCGMPGWHQVTVNINLCHSANCASRCEIFVSCEGCRAPASSKPRR